MDIIIRNVEEKDGQYKIYNKDGTGGHWYISKASAEEVSSQIESGVETVACENCQELNQLFELEHKRITEAEKYWQEKTGRHDTFPDLGSLLKFLMDKIIELESKPKIAEVTEQIANKSFLANDCWDSTNEFRRYQDSDVPVIEAKEVISIIKSNFSV